MLKFDKVLVVVMVLYFALGHLLPVALQYGGM